jgi:chaperonin cofactor prefoldin
MTNMDDQIAKHIRELLLKATKKASDNAELTREAEALNRVVRTLRRAPDYPYDLVLSAGFR